MTEGRPVAAAGLEVEDLHAWYGKSHVLQGVTLAIRPGEIVALLGRNGVGRSTTARAIMGLVRCRGSIRYGGRQILGRPTFEIARLGIGYVPENRDCFPTLTVEQNLILGRKAGPGAGKAGRPWGIDDLFEIFPRLAERRHTVAGVLSGGEQQMLTLARSLMGNPDLLVIDEPTEGLAPQLVDQVATYFLRLRAAGISVLLIEQKLTIALAISERVYLMGRGEVVYEGTPTSLAAADQLRSDWLEV